ncbi:MAG: hypothetical protein V4564_04345 [Pseudomonadota bacterium]
MTEPFICSRRHVLAGMAIAGGGALWPGGGVLALPGNAVDHAHDWDWLRGSWDVSHKRLKTRLAGSTEWEEFAGKSVLWTTLGGLGTIDDNALDFPDGTYRGLGIRAFDPASGTWSIWWLDGRNATRIDAPVRGGFHGDEGAFSGPDIFEGRPVTARFRWHEIHSARPHWDQALSTDGGRTWEINWRNWFTRTSATPVPLPARTDTAPGSGDWDFLVGSWSVRHRKLTRRLVGSTDWIEFGGTLTNWPVLGGRGNVGDNMFDLPGGRYRGVGLRALDGETGLWNSWWLDGRTPDEITAPVSGKFANGSRTLTGDDVHEGKPVKARIIWSRITATSARWEQALSADGGATWEVNWTSDFTRTA